MRVKWLPDTDGERVEKKGWGSVWQKNVSGRIQNGRRKGKGAEINT